jgi:uncharacterized membrane protein
MEMLIRGADHVNVGWLERWLSVLGGAALLRRAGRNRKLGSALLGADLIRRGVSGHCYLYQFLGVSSTSRKNHQASIPYRQGIRVDEAITIDKTPQELYQFWRQLDTLPYFMEHLESVTLIDATRSHWIAKGPAGKHVEWDAEIIGDIPNEMIGWRSLPGSQIDTAGSVHFTPAPGGRGTEVTVALQYHPPGGIFSALFAKVFGEEPELQVREDLRHLKQLLEAGEIPTTQGQPEGGEAAGWRPRSEKLSTPKDQDGTDEAVA